MVVLGGGAVVDQGHPAPTAVAVVSLLVFVDAPLHEPTTPI